MSDLVTIGICVLIVGGVCILALLALLALRSGDRALRDYQQKMRDDGIDPDDAFVRGIGQMQAAERPGWHPIRRTRMKAMLYAWKRAR